MRIDPRYGALPILLLRGVVRALCAAVLVASAAAPAAGQVTGRVIGKVLDAQTGEPLVGGLVVIESTNLGNVTDGDGSFFINDVPVGRHRITSQYLGYTALTEVRRVLAGQTIDVQFRMPSDMIAAQAIAAVIEREPWRPPPPVRVYTRHFPPTDLPERLDYECSARAVLHGAYIAEARWQLQSSVRTLACRVVMPQTAPPLEETAVVRVSPPVAVEGQN